MNKIKNNTSSESVENPWNDIDTNREASIEANRRGYDQEDIMVGLDFLDKGKLYIDPKVVPPDKVYVYARERLLNEDRQDELDALIDNGFDYVLQSDNPALANKRAMQFSRHNDDPRIRRYGMVLLQMDKNRYERIQRHYDIKSNDARKASNALAAADPAIRGSMYIEENSMSYQQHYQNSRGFYK